MVPAFPSRSESSMSKTAAVRWNGCMGSRFQASASSSSTFPPFFFAFSACSAAISSGGRGSRVYSVILPCALSERRPWSSASQRVLARTLMMTGAAGRWMRLTGSNSPERMLTLQLLSRSESTRTSHSLPSHIALAMRAFLPAIRPGMRSGLPRWNRAGGPRRQGSGAPRDLRRVPLDPERAEQRHDEYGERQPEEAAGIATALHAHHADPRQLARLGPLLLPFTADEVVRGDDAALPEEQELLVAPDGQLAARVAHLQLHAAPTLETPVQTGNGSPVRSGRRGNPASASESPLPRRGANSVAHLTSHLSGSRVTDFAPRRSAACISPRKSSKCCKPY